VRSRTKLEAGNDFTPHVDPPMHTQFTIGRGLQDDRSARELQRLDVAKGESGVPSGGGGRRCGVRAWPWWWRVRRIGTETANVGRWGPGKLSDTR
jgi:hypothetical protein